MLDEKVTVEDEEAYATARELALKEGIFVGMSSGAAVAGALRIAQMMDSGRINKLPPANRLFCNLSASESDGLEPIPVSVPISRSSLLCLPT